MEFFKSTFKGITAAVVFLSIFSSTYLLADGTRQVSPTNSVNGTALLSAPDIGAGPYRNAADSKRLRFTILNNATEFLYFGFQPRTYDNNLTTLKNNVYYRIFNAAGTQVAGPTLIPVSAGPGFISTYAQAYAGPNIAGGAPTGYNPFVFNPATNGDFYIELYSSNNGGTTADVTVNGRVTFPLFDLTISTATNGQSIGRLWSKEWSLVTTNLTSGNFQQSLTSSFTGKFIAYTPDAFKLQVNYQFGFRPLAYRVAMNYDGIGNSGNFVNDRKSINSNTGAPTISNGYKVFLTDPDDVAFPDGTIGTAAITQNIFGCTGSYFIPYYKDQPGDISLLIDINGTAGYQAGTTDILLQEFGQPAGNNVFLWNGLDGLGNPLPANFTALVTAVLFQGRTNLPIYDAELNTGGLSVTGIFPATGNRPLYWDDSSLTPFGTCINQEENSTVGGINQSGLYQGVPGPAHAWDGSNPGLAVPAASGTQGSSTLGALCDDYGNNRTINTWFYASDVFSNTLSLTLPTCDNDNDGIADNLDLDDDNDGIYDVVEYTGYPDPLADTDSDGIPNFIDPSAAGFIDVNFDGVNDGYDFDGDGIINQFDLDTDNDGIPDNIEAQTTMGYVTPTGTINSQGVYPSYFALGGLIPVNTDGVDNPDYKDLNSDNEGGNDTSEAGITLTGLDSDNDGLDNTTDATIGYADVNGIYDNTQYDNFPDVDMDAQAGGNVDWRDAIFNDHDNDGVADIIDLDDDNDGILDAVENGSLPDALADADGDGILNYLDPTAVGFVDVNGDSVDDRYDFDKDGIINEFDLDSDNDGIFDVIEAGGVDSDNNGTANDDDDNVNNSASNGIPTSAGAGTTPLDFGSNGTPNYLNLDSDADGCFDVLEAGFTDQNNNGILGNNPTVVSVNGIVTGTNVLNGYTGTNANVTTPGTAANISTQPVTTLFIPSGAAGNISVVATGSGLAYQWQISTNGGSTWSNVSNGGSSPSYSGATSASLDLTNVPIASNGNQFRVLITSPTYICSNLTSGTTTLSVAPSADVSIVKTTSNSTPIVGGTVQFFLTVANATNGSTATGISVTDIIPAGYTISGTPVASPAIGTVNVSGQTITWNGFTLNSGANAILSITCNVTATNAYSNTATVTSSVPDPNSGNNTSTVIPTPIAQADLSITKVASSMTPVVGGTVTFTITASNAGLSNATGIVVTDVIPAGYTVSGLPAVSPSIGSISTIGQTVTWNGFSLNSGANATLTIVCNVLATGPYSNTATITSSVADPNSGNNSATVTPIPTSAADLTISKSVSSTTPIVGANVTFTITVTNNGPSSATNVVVRDTLKSGYLYVSSTAPAGMTYNTGGANIWQFTPSSALTLASGASAVFTITATVKPSGIYTNCANVSSSVFDPNLTNNRACAATITPIPQTDLNVTKTMSAGTPVVGSNVTFTLTANNAGPSNASGVIVTDVMPTGYTFVNTIPAGVGTYNTGNNTFTWPIGTLNSGLTTTSVQIVAVVNANGNYINCASITGNQVDPNSANNTGCVTPSPVPVANLSIQKSVGPIVANVGTTVEFGILVTNNGPSTATGVIVYDTLPAGFTYVSSIPAGLYNPSTHSWNVGTIASGGFESLLISAIVVPNGLEADYINTANVSSPIGDPVTTDNVDTAKVFVTQVSNLAVSKTYSPLNPTVGSQIEFTVTATNQGQSNATGVTILDPLPSGYSLDSVVTSVGTYSGGIWTIGSLSATVGINNQTMLVYAHVLASGNLTNTATISGDQPDPIPANNTVSVSPGISNSAPIANGDFATTSLIEDGANGSVQIVVNDTDLDGNPTVPTNGVGQFTIDLDPSTLTIDLTFNDIAGGTGVWTYNPASGFVTFNPALNYNGSAVIPYQLCDASGACDTALITFVVTPVNDAPSQGNETMTVAEDSPGTVSPNLTTNNIDPDGTILTVSAAGISTQGVVVIINAGGTITYSPPANFNGIDTLVYTVCDSGTPLPAICVNDTLFITVTPVNDAPIANGDFGLVTLIEDGANGTVQIISNDTDTDGNPTVPTNGLGLFTVDLNPSVGVQTTFTNATGFWSYDATTGDVTFDPALNFNGTATIIYTLCDPQGACDTALITFNVSPVNDAPLQGNETMTLLEGAPATITPVLTSNNIDPDGTIVTITSAGPSTQGVVVIINSGGTLIYTPPVGFNGIDTIIYTVCDSGTPLPAICVNDTLFITVTSVNDTPIANGDYVTPALLEDEANGTVQILLNDTDPDGNPTAPTNGSGQFTIDLDPAIGIQTSYTDGTGVWTYNPTTGVVSFDPANNFNGTATILYELCDAAGACDTALISFTVLAVNDTTSQGNENMTLVEDASSTVSPVLISNNIDPDGTTVYISSAGPSTQGVVVTINPGGTITYTPPANFNGIDTIIYTVCDSGTPLPAICVNDTLFITVTPVNDSPSQGNETMTLNEDASATVSPILTANNIDPDGTVVTITTAGPSTQGVVVTINPGGTITYTPPLNFNGIDTVVYTVCDGGIPLPSICVTDTLFITVIPINDVPVALNDTTSTDEDIAVIFNITNNDTDVDGNLNISTVVLSTSSNLFGTWTVDLFGNVTYTPALNFNGTASVNYTILDSTGAISNVATIYVIVNPINDTPVIVNDYLSTSINVAGSGDFITTADTDVDGTLTASVLVQGPTNGIFTYLPNGNFTYTPTPGYFGFDTVVVLVCDDGFPTPVICVNDTIFIEVIPTTPPVANPDFAAIDEDSPGVTFNVSANDTDLETSVVPSSVDLNTSASGVQHLIVNQYGTWTADNFGNVTYVPLANFCGLAYLNYYITDTDGSVSTLPALITVTVNCINDAPVTTDITLSTPINTPIGINVAAGTSDLENNPLTYSYGTPIASTTGINLNIDGIGAITVTPPIGFVGVITIPFTVCDASPYVVNVLCDSGTITLIVTDTNGINNAPIANNDLVSTPKDSSISVNPLGNDSDVNGDPLTVSILVGPTVPGSSVGPIGPLGQINYTPAPGFTGMDSLLYQICDNGIPQLCDVAYVIITVTPAFDTPNASPVATNDYATILENSSITYSVLSNDSDPNGDVITISSTIVSGPANGVATINPISGQITYVPNPNFNGQDTVEYQICDNGTLVLCDNGLFVITILPNNNGPVTTDITVSTPVNAPIGINVGAGTSDSENNPLTYTYGTPVSAGGPIGTPIVLISGNGTITVTPPLDFIGTITIPFQVCDSSAFIPTSLCDNGIITIIVVDTTGPNNVPIANDDQVTTPQGTSIVVNPLANDSDVDGDPLTVIILAGPFSLGSSAGPVGTNGTIPFNPGAGFTGIDSIQYQICDNGTPALCDIAWIYINVSPVVDTPNVAPIATDDFASTDEDTPVTIDVLVNDSDPNGNGLNNPIIFVPPNNGTATVNTNGTITYVPNPNFSGTDTLQYIVCDNGIPSLCDTATVVITVNGVNNGPSFIDIIVYMPENSSLGVNVGAAASDPENNLLNYTYGPAPAGISFVTTGNGVITVTSGTVGTYIIPVTICDSSAFMPNVLCTNGTITVIVMDTVGSLNHQPVANHDQVTTPMNTSIYVNPIANDFDVDNDSLTVTTPLGVLPSGAIVDINANGIIIYTPTFGYIGLDSILYQICDDGLPILCDEAYIYVNVVPVVDTPNVAPIATDDYAFTDVNTPITVDVLNNDSDPNGNALNSPTILTGPAVVGNTAIVTSGGNITFTPDPSFVGTDSVQYVVCDQGSPSSCDTAWLFVTVHPTNNGPITTDITVITSVDVPVGVNVGAGTSDPENNPLNYTYDLTGIPVGTIVDTTTGTGSIDITPAPGYVGTFTISFTVCDSSAYSPTSICTTGLITVIVIDTTGGINNPPIANNDFVVTLINTPIIINPIANDFDVNGDPLSVTTSIGTLPSGGMVGITASGLITYAPAPGYTGLDSIPYQICDNGTLPLCDVAWIYIQVVPVVDSSNVPPIATNDYAFTNEDSPITVPVLNNDSDPNGNSIGSPTILVGPMFGAAVVNPDSTITYIPGPNFNGTDTITYQICDDGNPVLCDIGQVIIFVLPVNDAPTTSDITVITSQFTLVGINVGAGTSDPENNPLTYNYDLSGVPAGTIVDTNVGTGTINVTPPAGFVGTFTIPFTVCDSSAFATTVLCDNGSITVIVVDTTDGINDAPIANNDLVNALVGTTTIAINPLGNDTDPNNDPLVVMITTGPSVGTAIVNANGTIDYTPASGFIGIDSIQYTICDNGTPPLCDEAWIYITINPVVDTSNVAPIATDDFASTPADVAIIVTVLNNDSDPNGNSIGQPSITVIPANGNATVNTAGQIVYTPNAGFVGLDSLLYTICDDGIPVLCDQAMVYILVYTPNEPPSAGNETISISKWCSDSLFTTIDVLSNNIDPNGDSLIVTVSSSSAMGGSVTVDANGNIVYAALQNYVGMDTVIYTVCDTFVPTACVTDTIFITVLPDNDCDGIPDPIDIDDDNDGIQDIIECSSALGACDTDGDGIPDYFDLDSDNDGIPDIVEAGGAQYDLNNDGIIDDTLDADNDGLFDVADGNSGGTYLPNPDMDGDGHPNFQDLDADGDGITDLIESGGVDVDGNGLVDTFNDSDNNGMDDDDTIFDPLNSDGDLNFDFLDLDADNDGISDVLESGQLDANGDGRLDVPTNADTNNDGFADALVSVFPQDYDQDGVADFKDLDSDNDAIPDVVENGSFDDNQDGLVDGYSDANNNGWNDGSQGTQLLNSDSDPIADYHDLDSDQDGIPDVLEGGQDDLDHNGLVDLFADANGNGWSDPTEGDTIYDWDSDGLPDYLDHDTDSDGILDVIEGGFFDDDHDGVIDNFTDPDNDGWDTNATGQIIPDTDGDGIPDFRDYDSDGDGIPDILEYGNDCDLDGIDDWLDADPCNFALDIPNGFTPNGDGFNDFFVIEGIEIFPGNTIQFYNRWGNQVFGTDDYQNNWAGTSNSKYNIGGEELPTGTYYYVFDTKTEAYGVISGYVYIQR
ncbi:MAG: Ig-like domain-containing protein [Crocinitomicaceae bacterium]